MNRRRCAVRDPPDVQVVTLNVLSEGVALDFFSAVTPVLDRLKIFTGRYWRGDSSPDAHHVRLGFDRLADALPDSPRGQQYQRTLWHGATLYHQMLSSWVGKAVEPLATLWAQNAPQRCESPAFALPPSAAAAPERSRSEGLSDAGRADLPSRIWRRWGRSPRA